MQRIFTILRGGGGDGGGFGISRTMQNGLLKFNL